MEKRRRRRFILLLRPQFEGKDSIPFQTMQLEADRMTMPIFCFVFQQ